MSLGDSYRHGQGCVHHGMAAAAAAGGCCHVVQPALRTSPRPCSSRGAFEWQEQPWSLPAAPAGAHQGGGTSVTAGCSSRVRLPLLSDRHCPAALFPSCLDMLLEMSLTARYPLRIPPPKSREVAAPLPMSPLPSTLKPPLAILIPSHSTELLDTCCS